MSNIFQQYFKSVENSISRRLLRSVLSIYFALTLIVTSVHILIEYYNAKSSVQTVLEASENTYHDILAADMWEYNYEKLSINSDSMMSLPYVTGIEISELDEIEPMFIRGKTRHALNRDQGLFWHEFELKFMDDELHTIGMVRVYSDSSIVLDQIESGIYILIINAIIKTIALVFLVTIVFHRLLTRPLNELSQHAESIDTDSSEYNPIQIADNSKDELGLLQGAMNRMMAKMTDAIQRLDSMNKELEKKVLARTEKLRDAVVQLDKEQISLKNEVESRKSSELALSKSLAQLQQAQVKLVASEKMASLGTLAAGIAHEINNPISFVMQNVNVLSEYNEAFHTLIKDYKSFAETGLIVDEKANELLNNIKQYEKEEDLEFIISDSLSLLKSTEDGISRVVEIVKNMKSFSHPDEETVHHVDVHEVIESTLLLLKNETEAKVRIVKKFNASTFNINSNRNQLGQVFLNLIMNAVQATQDKSDAIISIRTETDGDELCIYIADNGSGIPEDKINLIFDPFYTSKGVGEGTGMGLAISYGIVKKYNGQINVTSMLGKGTQFTLQFPLESKY